MCYSIHMEYGTTLSPRHLEYINVPLKEALKGIDALGFKWLRLACYWEEIERKEAECDFSAVDTLVDFCEQKGIKVLMTIGMKAPRWPEYYVPEWVSEKINIKRASKINTSQPELLTHTLAFIKDAVNHYKKSTAIKAWQVENEPLDPSGPQWLAISPMFLTEEVKLVKKLDKKRSVVINLWGNELSRRRLYPQASEIGDIVGLDLYLRNPVPYLRFLHKYVGPLDSKETIKTIVSDVKKKKKEVWITELQAEPWEPNQLIARRKFPPSFKPQHLKENLQFAKDLKVDKIFFWGYEYWLQQKLLGVPEYWKEAKGVLTSIK